MYPDATLRILLDPLHNGKKRRPVLQRRPRRLLPPPLSLPGFRLQKRLFNRQKRPFKPQIPLITRALGHGGIRTLEGALHHRQIMLRRQQHDGSEIRETVQLEESRQESVQSGDSRRGFGELHGDFNPGEFRNKFETRHESL